MARPTLYSKKHRLQIDGRKKKHLCTLSPNNVALKDQLIHDEDREFPVPISGIDSMITAESDITVEYLDFGQRIDQRGRFDSKNAIMTDRNLYQIWQKWIRFCETERKGDWFKTLKQKCTVGTCGHFLKYILDNYRPRKGKRPKYSSVCQYWRQFKMLFAKANGFRIDTNTEKEVQKFIRDVLKPQYGLDMSLAPKPVLSADDIRTILLFHWTQDSSVFPDERQRVQVPAAILFATYLAARTAELVDGELSEATQTKLKNWDLRGEEPIDWTQEFGFAALIEPEERCKALCYEDITLMVVRDPDRDGQHTLAAEVLLSHHKGMDNKPKPVIFPLFLQKEPMLCPLTHLIALAIHDRAFENPYIVSTEQIFDLRVEGPVQGTIIPWNYEMRRVPVFQHHVKAVESFIPSERKPLSAALFGFYLGRLGRAAGFQDKLTMYCARRCTANALIEGAPVPVREQAMRHEHGSAVIHAYLNRRTNYDIQALIHSEAPRQGLVRNFAHMGFRRDPRAPVSIPDNLYDALPADPKIRRLELQKNRLKRKLRASSTIRSQRLNGSEEVKQYDQLVAKLNAARVKRRKEVDQSHRAEYFEKRHSKDIERQLQGIEAPEYVESMVEHQIGERNELQQIFRDDRNDLSSENITQRQRQTARLLARLCSRREVHRHYRRANIPKQQHRRGIEGVKADTKDDTVYIKIESSPSPAPDLFPLVCKKTQCPVCIGDESLEYEQRLFCYSRPAKMMDHVEGHLRGISADSKIPCWHPYCKSNGIFLDGVIHYKNHVMTVHGIALRAFV